MLPSRSSILFNLLLTYTNWFAVAILAGMDQSTFAFLTSLVVVGIHLLMTSSEKRQKEITIIGCAALVGLLAETLFLFLGTVHYTPNLLLGYFPPLFMIGLWMAFATTFHTSLFWLQSRLLFAAVIGFIVSGPSYYAGEKLGALTLTRPLSISLFEIGIVWSCAFPFLFFLARRD
ncbi:MAG: DUF2878 domain-containing protein [Hyphomicrobium sp.]